MMQAGIFTGYFPYGLEETAQKIRGLGFNTVQLDLHFKDVDLSAGQITKDKAKKVRDVFRDNNLPVCCVSGYTNIIHPDKKEREKRVGYLKEIIRNARHFGSPYVISETGTYNTESDWVHHPKNKTEEGFEECRKVDRRPRPDRLRPRRGLPARDLRQQRRRLGRGDGEDVRAGRPSRPRPADGPDQLFRDAQHRPDGPDPEPGVRHADRQDQDRPRQGREALGRRQVGEACRHRRRGRAGEPHFPRRRRDRAAGARPRLAELRPLSASGSPRSTRTFPSSSSTCRRTTCRAPRNSSTGSSARTGSEEPADRTMVQLYGQKRSRRDIDASAGSFSQFAGVQADDARRRKRARRPAARVPDRHRPALHRDGRSRLRHRRMRVSRHGDRLAFADRLQASGICRI